ncbi:hypothetical protein ACFZCY_00030 [Streptomyces sp. NPDC007983]|uniref:hypothetical protein n=1 Tax=Streptomyces sp. NPDC007983 TaxID=3364800 RepID=UPI0036E2B675
MKARFPDGQLYVNLRGYDPGEPVTAQEALHRFLTGLGVPANAVPVNTESAAALFRSLPADRRILIVLDNAATAAQVRPLLPGHSAVSSSSPAVGGCPGSPYGTGRTASPSVPSPNRKPWPSCGP